MITQEELKYFLDYNPETGIFRWKNPTTNRVNVGFSPNSKNSQGYQVIGINKKRYQAHRLAFLWMTGSFPNKEVDHINGNRQDNRWKNLRQASKVQNQENRKKSSSNKSGIKGVYWHKGHDKWIASIRFDGKRKHLGLFDNINDAAIAYANGAKRYFGEFARLT